MNFVGETVSAKLAFESQSRCAHCDTIAAAVMYRANELEFFQYELIGVLGRSKHFKWGKFLCVCFTINFCIVISRLTNDQGMFVRESD